MPQRSSTPVMGTDPVTAYPAGVRRTVPSRGGSLEATGVRATYTEPSGAATAASTEEKILGAAWVRSTVASTLTTGPVLGGPWAGGPSYWYRPVDASVFRAGVAGTERSPLAAVGPAADGVVAGGRSMPTRHPVSVVRTAADAATTTRPRHRFPAPPDDGCITSRPIEPRRSRICARCCHPALGPDRWPQSGGDPMTCTHCNAVEQRGRYCVGCGKLLPPSPLPPRP